jgi:hypothetical protein
VEGVDHLADVGLLQLPDTRRERQDLVVDDRADPDPVDVVGGVEGVALDVVGAGLRCRAQPSKSITPT